MAAVKHNQDVDTQTSLNPCPGSPDQLAIGDYMYANETCLS